MTMHPFSRNAVASFDWGGVMMNKYLSRDNKSRHQRYTSDVFEMATAITNQSSVNCVCLYPNNLQDVPQWELDWLKGLAYSMGRCEVYRRISYEVCGCSP